MGLIKVGVGLVGRFVEVVKGASRKVNLELKHEVRKVKKIVAIEKKKKKLRRRIKRKNKIKRNKERKRKKKKKIVRYEKY